MPTYAFRCQFNLTVSEYFENVKSDTYQERNHSDTVVDVWIFPHYVGVTNIQNIVIMSRPEIYWWGPSKEKLNDTRMFVGSKRFPSDSQVRVHKTGSGIYSLWILIMTCPIRLYNNLHSIIMNLSIYKW